MSTAFDTETDRVPTHLSGVMDLISGLDTNQSDGELIDQITMLERIKSACAAGQARLTQAFAQSQRADGDARKVHPDRTRRSIAAQIALARRDSRFRGQQSVGVAHALVADMPETLSALGRGDLTEYRARVIITELACLTPADRTQADTMIAAELPELGDRTAESRAAAIAYRLDPEAVMSKIRGAVKDRHVSLRPAPDTMSRLSALLPVSHGVAVYAALAKCADSTIATGDGRARGQIMADELVSRITGGSIAACDPYGAPRASYDRKNAAETGSGGTDIDNAVVSESKGRAVVADSVASTAPACDIEAKLSQTESQVPAAAERRDEEISGPRRSGGVQLSVIMTDRTLFGCDDEPAHLIGHGPIPAALARSLVCGRADDETTTWVRRLYTDPSGSQLVAMDSAQRLFPANAVKFLIARDQTCRTPWCDAPIRHIDHVQPHSRGGPTNIGNGQGLCQACNLSKQAPGWQSRAGGNGVIETTTPTGHRYWSRPPQLPTSSPWPRLSAFEERLAARALTAA
jgi:hypothetical protein